MSKYRETICLAVRLDGILEEMIVILQEKISYFHRLFCSLKRDAAYTVYISINFVSKNHGMWLNLKSYVTLRVRYAMGDWNIFDWTDDLFRFLTSLSRLSDLHDASLNF